MLNRRMTAIYAHAIETHDRWLDRTSQMSELRGLANAVTDPGRHLLGAPAADAQAASEQLARAKADFDAAVRAVRSGLASAAPGEGGESITSALQSAVGHVDAAFEAERRLIAASGLGDDDSLQRQQVIAEHELALLDADVTVMTTRARAQQRSGLAPELDAVRNLGRWQDAVSGLVAITLLAAAAGGWVQARALIRTVRDRDRSERTQQVCLAAIESAQDMILITDAAGRIEYSNPAFTRCTGYSAKEVLGRSASVLRSGRHDAAFYNDLWRTIKGGGVWQGRITNRRKDGSQYCEEMSITPVRSADGSINRFVAIKRDVSRRQKAEQEMQRVKDELEVTAASLLRQTQVLRSIIDHIPENVFWKDSDSVYLGCGLEFAKQAGLKDSQDVIGKTDFDMPWTRAEAEEYRAGDRKVIQSGQPLTQDETLLTADGRRLSIQTSKVPLRDAAGRVIGVLGIYHDITERKRVEAMERERAVLTHAVSAMEQVIGVVAHELRTPLAGLRAISELLLDIDRQNTADVDSFLRSINQETIRMAETVNGLLEAARINSGKAAWDWGDVGLQAAVEAALDTVRPLVDEGRVELRCAVEPAGLQMCGDAAAIRRLVVNLLGNARKHTTSGHIGVRVSEHAEGGERWVDIAVDDSGEGIPPAIASRLGEAFALNSGVVGANCVKGTGLGLAICKAIVAAHGGSIHVQSAVGQGTTVTARLRADLGAPQQDQVHINFVTSMAGAPPGGAS